MMVGRLVRDPVERPTVADALKHAFVEECASSADDEDNEAGVAGPMGVSVAVSRSWSSSRPRASACAPSPTCPRLGELELPTSEVQAAAEEADHQPQP